MDNYPTRQSFIFTKEILNEDLSDATYIEVHTLLTGALKDLANLDANDPFIPSRHRRTTMELIWNCRIALAPHKKLPPELLAKIFHYRFSPPLKIPSEDFKGILGLCQVCSRWRAVALATPSLWSNLKVAVIDDHTDSEADSEGDQAFMMMAKEILSRSAPSMMSLAIDAHSHILGVSLASSSAWVSDLVTPNASRLRSLELKSAPHSGLRLFLTLPPGLFDSLESFKLQHRLRGNEHGIWRDDSFGVTVLEDAQSLRHVSLDWSDIIPFPSALRLPWAQLTELNLDTTGIPPFAAQHVIRLCINLVQCSVRLGRLTDEATSGLVPNIVLKKLERLRIKIINWKKYATDRITFLRPFIVPSLQDFEVLALVRGGNLQPAFISFIKRSSITLKKLKFSSTNENEAFNLLAAVPFIVDLSLTEVESLSTSTLKLMSTGDLCPRLEILECWVDIDNELELIEMLEIRYQGGEGGSFSRIQQVRVMRYPDLGPELVGRWSSLKDLGIDIQLTHADPGTEHGDELWST